MQTTIEQPFAGLIPDPDTIRRELESKEGEADLLRKLLRLSLARQRELERLAARSGGKEAARAS